MIWEISSALISICLPYCLFGQQLFAELLQLGTDAAVIQDVAELRDHAAHDRRIFLLFQNDHLARRALERGLEPLLQRRIERTRGGDRGPHPTGMLVDQGAVRARDVRQRADAALVE